jgi:LuxR family transcriptional regulator, maltose regulon positive regulatory protein
VIACGARVTGANFPFICVFLGALIRFGGVGLMSDFVGAPPVPHGTVLRQRLLDRLNASAGVTIVCGPSGAGKTTLVAQWAAVRGGAGLWVAFDAAVDSPAKLWSRLLEESARCGWLDAPDLLRDLNDPGCGDFPTTRADHVGRTQPRPVNRRTLVLDNLDLIGAEAADRLLGVLPALSVLIDCVLLTRNTGLSDEVDGDLPAVNIVDAGELLLTDAELAAILEPVAGFARYDQLTQAVSRVPLAARTAVVAHEQWAGLFDTTADSGATLLALIMSAVAGIPDDPAGRSDQFAEFADFLAETSVASSIDPRLAAELSGLPVSRTRYYLIRAVELGFGRWETAWLDGGSPMFRYIGTVARPLREEFARRSPDGFRDACRRLADWAERHGRWDTAAETRLQISDLDAANRGLSTHLGDLIGSGGAEVRGRLAALEPAGLQNYPFLAVAAAIADLARGPTGKADAEGLLSRAVDEAQRQEPEADPAEKMMLTAVETVAPRLLGELDAAHRASLKTAATIFTHVQGRDNQLSESAAEAVQQTLRTLLRAADVRAAENILTEPALLPGRTGRPFTDFQLSSMAAVIRAWSGEIHAARATLRRIDRNWPRKWQDEPAGWFYHLARLIVATESLDFDQARTAMAAAESGIEGMPLVSGIYGALIDLLQGRPELAYDYMTKVADDRSGSSPARIDLQVLGGWRAFALYCMGDGSRADALMASLDPCTPWPTWLRAVWALAAGRPGQALTIADEIAARLPIASDAIFERQWPTNSAALRATAYHRLGRDHLALAELDRLTTDITVTGRRLPLAFMPSQDLTELLALAPASGNDRSTEVIGDVSQLPDPLGRRST